MRVLLALCAFVLVALAQNREVCFPDVFTTDQITEIPDRHDFFVNRIYFDFPAQRQRIDIDLMIENFTPRPERLTFYFDYPRAKWFEVRVNETTRTEHCTVNNLNGKLERLCLSRRARHRGSPLIGGVLMADNWVEEERAENNTRVVVDILADRNINIPLRVTQRRDRHFTSEEFWNFEERVNPDHFIIPSICERAVIGKRSPMTWEQVYRSAFPEGVQPIIPRAF